MTHRVLDAHGPYALVGVGQVAMGAANQTQTMLDVSATAGGTACGVSQAVCSALALPSATPMVAAVLVGLAATSLLCTHDVWAGAGMAAYGVIVATLAC